MVSSTEMPLVSIVIPCYNSENYVSECLESVLSQDYANIEVVVVDDGSTDSSLEILSRYPGIRVLSQANAGACVARNRGFGISRGKYVKFLDSDDLLEPGVIGRQVMLAENEGDNSIVYGDFFVLKNGKKRFQDTVLPKEHQSAALLFQDILTSTPLHRRWMIERIGGFDERFRNGQEWNLHVRLSSEGYFFVHQRGPVYCYRVHEAEGRISNKRKGGGKREEIEYTIRKFEMTRERLGENFSGDLSAAFAKHYWSVARGYFNAGALSDCKAYRGRSKESSDNYKFYWSKKYKIMHSFFGFYLAELIFIVFKLLKGRDFV